jgi:hypothetical protein
LHTPPTVYAWALDGTYMITGDQRTNAYDWPTSGGVNGVRTGAVLRDLRAWLVINVLVWPRLLVLRRDGPDGALVGRMDATTGHVVVFGRMSRPHSAPTCQVLDDLVVCRSGTDLSAFRIPV